MFESPVIVQLRISATYCVVQFDFVEVNFAPKSQISDDGEKVEGAKEHPRAVLHIFEHVDEGASDQPQRLEFGQDTQETQRNQDIHD